ncbi:MAG: SPOR domain-containing protein [Rhodospirillaceae bacterium]|nr:SPOR domain-containing protein [Rhodospirillaceae bacterium]
MNAAMKAPGAAGTETAPPAPETFTGPVLHLASFRSAEGARSAFEQAKAKNPPVFANLRFESRRTNVEGQGTFYRLLVGPFASLTDAEATCVEMKKLDQFCRPTADGS